MIAFDPAKHVPDLSHWEGAVDFDLFYLAGAPRLITKLTDGRHGGDPLAAYALRWARDRAQVPREAFHFLEPLEDVREQMEVFRRACWGCYLDPANDKLWLDVECIPLAWRVLGALKIRKLLRPVVLTAFREGLRLLGVMPGCYTRASLWNSYVGPVDWHAEGLPQPDLWSADYGLDGLGGGIAGPRWVDPVSWPHGSRRWQITDKGTIPGVRGGIDLNVERV